MDGGDRPAALGGRAPDVPTMQGGNPSPALRGFPAQAISPASDRFDPDSTRVRQALTACPEIDCLRSRLPPGVLAAAELRAAEIGVGADRVLIASGEVEEEAYLRVLALALGLRFETLEDVPRSACLIPDERLAAATAAGIVPVRIGGEEVFVVAPRCFTARRLSGVFRNSSDVTRRVRITSSARMREFIAHHGADAIGRKSKDELRAERPEMSAGTRRPSGLRTAFAAIFVAALAAWSGPQGAAAAIGIGLSLIFLGWAGLRLFGILSNPPAPAPARPVPDHALPIYTVIVALYREQAAVRTLVAALDALAYPPEKLDIKLVVEPDDDETYAALVNLKLRQPFEIIVAPDVGPRTKPKALNAALPFARGTFTAVYDAEDLPEPDQLRLALKAFLAGDQRLACVQARLTIDNTADCWLTRLFTAEYAGLFDVFLPGIAAWKLPLPLGGSSNHFRTASLREAGAWDPYNVTEDADLGMRLARLGYHTAMISSTTYEEAPAKLASWLRQRTRWFKGWMQTWLVHMREPFRLARELGGAGFTVFQLVVGGTVLASLVHPFFAALLVMNLMLGTSIAQDGLADAIVIGIEIATLAAGYLVSGLLGLIGLKRRGLIGSAWVLLLTPIYWFMLSLAAWRALLQLLGDPYRWEKTEHGLGRTSRSAKRTNRLDRILTK